MSAGLDASTVTPGRTASDASRTTPASVAWARAVVGVKTTRAPTRVAAADRCLIAGASCVTYGSCSKAVSSRCVRVNTLMRIRGQSESAYTGPARRADHKNLDVD